VKALGLSKDRTREGPQKCSGAIDIFKIRPTYTHNAVEVIQSHKTLPASMASDPTLCAMKYSISVFLDLFMINGRKDMRFTSIIIQIHGH